ncbi:MAG TPA: hypothetical protein VHU85_06915 [Acidimicrobiales bacterium]|nr:hypothetical protein [Acidimicrobiales bacterium]
MNGLDKTAKASLDGVPGISSRLTVPSFDGVSIAEWQAGKQATAVTTGSPPVISTGPTTVSIDLCGGAGGCRQLVAAARGSGQNCWYAREVLGSTPLPGGAQPGKAFAMTTGTARCTASQPPSTAWSPSWPTP